MVFRPSHQKKCKKFQATWTLASWICSRYRTWLKVQIVWALGNHFSGSDKDFPKKLMWNRWERWGWENVPPPKKNYSPKTINNFVMMFLISNIQGMTYCNYKTDNIHYYYNNWKVPNLGMCFLPKMEKRLSLNSCEQSHIIIHGMHYYTYLYIITKRTVKLRVSFDILGSGHLNAKGRGWLEKVIFFR